MPEVQDRIEKLGNSILSDAQKKAEEIISKAQQQADELTEQAREQYRRSEENEVALDRQKTHTLYAKELSKSDFAAHKSVLAHRCGLVDSLFEDIKNKLEEFAKSDKYSGFMTALAEKADKEQAFSKDCVINVGRNDIGNLLIRFQRDGQAIVNTLLKQKKERCYCLEYQIWNNMKQRKKNMRL